MIRAGDRCSCSEALLRLHEYVDRALPPSETRRVEAHLEECLHCAGRFRFEVALIGLIRERLRRIEVPAGLLESVLRRLAESASP